MGISRGGKDLIISDGLTPEKQCLLNDVTDGFFSLVSKRLKRSSKFKRSPQEVQEKIMEKYKRRADLGLEAIIWQKMKRENYSEKQ